MQARFPVLDKLLMEVRFCTSPISGPKVQRTLLTEECAWGPGVVSHPDGSRVAVKYDSDDYAETLWCGMYRTYLSLDDRRQGSLRLSQDTSMSRERGVAEFFLRNQGSAKAEGTLFQLQLEHGSGAAHLTGQRGSQEQMFFGDLSWLSKFPNEEETLVEAGIKIMIDGIEEVSHDPFVELVRGTLTAGCGMFC